MKEKIKSRTEREANLDLAILFITFHISIRSKTGLAFSFSLGEKDSPIVF